MVVRRRLKLSRSVQGLDVQDHSSLLPSCKIREIETCNWNVYSKIAIAPRKTRGFKLLALYLQDDLLIPVEVRLSLVGLVRRRTNGRLPAKAHGNPLQK